MHYSSIICSYTDNKAITLSISNDYSVFSFGLCRYSSHGHSELQLIYPKQINNLKNIKMIDCGSFHTLCLDFNGNVFSFGLNDEGQLGIGKDKQTLLHSYKPLQVNLPTIKQVSCGSYFSVCLSEDGNLYSFGYNKFGELGLAKDSPILNFSTDIDTYIPSSVIRKKLLTSDGLDFMMSGDFVRTPARNEILSHNSPQLIPNLSNIEFVTCGGSHTICKSKDNICYSWGFNGSGQLGENYTKIPKQCTDWPDNIIDIKCGTSHSLLLTDAGCIYMMGKQFFSDLPLSYTPTLIENIPEIQRIESGYNHSLCIDINHNLWVFGSNEYGQLGLGNRENKQMPILHPTLSNIIDISSRGNSTFVKTIDNKIYAFGYNRYSQLGIKTSEIYQLTPIQVFQDNENIWCSFLGKSKQKSARK